MSAMIDLRSDTVTLPTRGMRKAMAVARVGDSRRGEDPTVRTLEEYSAALFGKEAGLFVPSGTMGNLCALAAWTRPGDVIVASSSSHIAGREGPAVSHIASVAIAGIDAPGGIFSAGDVAGAIAATLSGAESEVRLVTAENTHNAGGGTVFPLKELNGIRSLCAKHSLSFHIDGSRIFNASAASGVAPASYGKVAGSLMFCLSKGLGAPVGSVLAGSRDFIAEARRVGLRVGGGMRQAGIVAAGGLYALRHHVGRLAEDHENARALARGLAEIPGVKIVNAPVETNIVLFRWCSPMLSPLSLRESLAGGGVLIDDRAFPLFRAVTHLGIGKREIARAIRALGKAFGGGKRATGRRGGRTPKNSSVQ